MPLELESLKSAVTNLRDALAISENAQFMQGLDDTTRNLIKAGVIQHFEIAYELCWKFIQRWLKTNIAPDAVNWGSRRGFFRIAAENRLIDDVDRWMRHHAARNETSHIYQKETAEKVYAAVPAFCRDAEELLEVLEARND